jgi:hypothetical protein
MMDKQRGFRIPVVILSICICLSGLAILPAINFEGLPVLGTSEIGLEQVEFEEDIFIIAFPARAILGLVFTKFSLIDPGFRPACLSPICPPPKKS